MTDHVEGIHAAIALVVCGVVMRYVFVMKRDCLDKRDTCGKLVCTKIESATVQTNETKEALKNVALKLDAVSKTLAELKGSFKQFLADFDRNNK